MQISRLIIIHENNVDETPHEQNKKNGTLNGRKVKIVIFCNRV